MLHSPIGPYSANIVSIPFNLQAIAYIKLHFHLTTECIRNQIRQDLFTYICCKSGGRAFENVNKKRFSCSPLYETSVFFLHLIQTSRIMQRTPRVRNQAGSIRISRNDTNSLSVSAVHAVAMATDISRFNWKGFLVWLVWAWTGEFVRGKALFCDLNTISFSRSSELR